MKRALLLLVVGCLLVTASSCGWIFVHNFDSNPSEQRGTLIWWVLVLDILGGLIPVLVDVLTGGLWESTAGMGDGSAMVPDSSGEKGVILPASVLGGRICLP